MLLKDLCSRLPYGVVIQEKCVEQDKTFLPNKEGDRLVNIDARTHGGLLMTNSGSWYYLDEIKPYLFPLSAITDEQKNELREMEWSFDNSTVCNILECFGTYRAYVDHFCCY